MSCKQALICSVGHSTFCFPYRWEVMDLIQESLLAGTAVICERYAWSGAVYSFVSNPQLPLKAYMSCDQGMRQPDIVVLLTTSPQESMDRRNAISPQFEDEVIQQRLWNTFHEDCLWEGVKRLDFHPLLRPHESRKHLQVKLSAVLKEEISIDRWKYLWETPHVCKVCHTDTTAHQPIQMCTSCYQQYQQVHHVCLSNDDQAAPIPICRACASGADPDREEIAAAEVAMPPG